MEASFVTHLRSAPPRASFSGFERFFREEYPAVVRIAFGVVGDAQAAQDVAQDVFISAFKRFPEPAESDHARAWVRAAAAHTALNAIRGERRQGDPFLALTAPPWQYLVWAGIWLGGMLTLGLVSFARREL
jgi:DNA-directed RNA polymerase specialized sigma24 family protein